MGQALRSLSEGIAKLPENLEQLVHQYQQQQQQQSSQKTGDGCGGGGGGEEAELALDLARWPPELSLYVLKQLNATDLCLAACVWTELAKDDTLWHSLCCSQWGYLSCYFRSKPAQFSYHKLYLTLDEASVTFNADCHLGMEYFFRHHLIDDDPNEIAQFFYRAKPLDRTQVRYYLNARPEILDSLVNLQDFSNQTLPDALRKFFALLEAPEKYDHYLHLMVDKFSKRFVKCNSTTTTTLGRGHTPETIYVLSFSLIMLSVDLCNPNIKNKMSKREFIRNVRRAIRIMDDELYGHLYDDIYLRGHIAATTTDAAAEDLQRMRGNKVIRTTHFASTHFNNNTTRPIQSHNPPAAAIIIGGN